MKKSAYSIALTLLVASFLVGTVLTIMLIWFENFLGGETAGKALVTCGIVFVASGIACIFLREVKTEDTLKKNNLIN